MIRVNTRVRKDLNDWLDQQVDETGVPKSTQIMFAIEMYQQQKMAKGQLTELAELIEKLEEFATYNDSLEEVFENKEQIEVSKFYEKLPKPHALAVQEWEEGKIYYREAK